MTRRTRTPRSVSYPQREQRWNRGWRAGAAGYQHGWRNGGWNPHGAPRSTRPWLVHLGVNVGGVDDPVLRARAGPGRRRPAGAEWGDPDGNATGPVPDPYADDVRARVRPAPRARIAMVGGMGGAD